MTMRRLDELLRDPGVEGMEFLSREQFEAIVPKCPTCKEPLVCRDSSRRFIEDDRYAECENGHIWNLTTTAE